LTYRRRSVSIVTGFGMGDRGSISGKGRIFASMSRPALRLTQPPVLFPNVCELKQPEQEANHLPLSSAKIENAWNFSSAPAICSSWTASSSAWTLKDLEGIVPFVFFSFYLEMFVSVECGGML
jgi:hypothetical protein